MSFDRSFLANPLLEYFKWLAGKSYYQYKYRGNHLRICYNAIVKGCTFGRYNMIGGNTKLINSHVGDHSYFAENSVINDCTIGKFCSIGPNVRISPGRHPAHFVSTHPATYNNAGYGFKNFGANSGYTYDASVKIGNDVWVGANVVIMNGVTIGDGAIIGANSVITKSVGNYEIVGGLPAKLIKKRFNDYDIMLLNAIQWWDKGDDWIQKHIAKFWTVKDFVDVTEDIPSDISRSELVSILQEMNIKPIDQKTSGETIAA